MTSCPDCGNANRPGATECEFCGRALVEGGEARRTRVEQVPDTAKRRTVYEPPPAADDPFGSPPRRRAVYDPQDPFRAALAPPGPAAPPAQGAPPAQAAPPAETPPRRPTLVQATAQAARRAGAVLWTSRGPDDPGRVHVLSEGRNTLGRDESQDIQLDDGRVSGQHAFVFVRPDGVSFIDVSTNGSLVDGALVHGRQVDVDTGAVLRLGDTLAVLTRLAALPPDAWGSA